MLKVVLAGSVGSSFATLKKLTEHEINIAAVLGCEPKDAEKVSGYVNMQNFCTEHNIPYYPFAKINTQPIKNILQEIKPDIFFVVGLSQLIPTDMLAIAKLGNIGFHPTVLPTGRGRAPIAWLILEEKYGAANFFLMGEGADDGPVFVQKKFEVNNKDNAGSIEKKIILSINEALDEWLPELKNGVWNPVPQEEMNATYYGKRMPDDGLINWEKSAAEIDKLIRASSNPHPGAFSFLSHKKIIIQSSKLEHELKIKGVTGRVLIEKDNGYLVQTGNGLIWISDIMDELNQKVVLKTGQKLGYYPELEIYKLTKEILEIKQKIGI